MREVVLNDADAGSVRTGRDQVSILSGADDQTMSFYDQDDLAFCYELAVKSVISDRQFASVLGPTFPNRSYLMAATSFGHPTSSDAQPPAGVSRSQSSYVSERCRDSEIFTRN